MLKIEFDTSNLNLVRGLVEGFTKYIELTEGKPEAASDTPVPITELADSGGTTTPEIHGQGTGKDSNDNITTPQIHGQGTGKDSNDVAFNPRFCGKAKQPFKQDGTWKKRRGVAKSDYDIWYKSALPKGIGQIDTGLAFSSPPAAPPAPTTAPTDLGAFMLWASEQQAAGRITQDDISAAYTAIGIEMKDVLRPDQPAEVVAGYIAQLYAHLNAL